MAVLKGTVEKPRIHTIARKDWWNYPCLDEKKCKVVYRLKTKDVHLKIFVGVQDKFHVAGHEWKAGHTAEGSHYNSSGAGRKGGEYKSAEEAELKVLNSLIEMAEERWERYKKFGLGKVIEELKERKKIVWRKMIAA